MILRSNARVLNGKRRLLVAKSRRFNDIKPASDNIQGVIREVSMHKSFCASFGISEEELESTSESSATTAYGAYLLDSGLHGNCSARAYY